LRFFQRFFFFESRAFCPTRASGPSDRLFHPPDPKRITSFPERLARSFFLPCLLLPFLFSFKRTAIGSGTFASHLVGARSGQDRSFFAFSAPEQSLGLHPDFFANPQGAVLTRQRVARQGDPRGFGGHHPQKLDYLSGPLSVCPVSEPLKRTTLVLFFFLCPLQKRHPSPALFLFCLFCVFS